MNQRLGYLGDHFMQSIHRHTPVSTNVFFYFLNEIVVCQRLPTSPWFIMSNVLTAWNLWHHFNTFCLFITSPYTLTIRWWISAPASLFMLRNQIRERTSHLVAFGTDTSILNSQNTQARCNVCNDYGEVSGSMVDTSEATYSGVILLSLPLVLYL
jgi:hypothetical protein